MKLEELKYELPETPDFIHRMIQDEVVRQTTATNVIPMRRKRRPQWSMRRAAVAAAACLAVTSTVAYAGVKFYHMYMEKQGNYGLLTGIQAGEEGNAPALPSEIPDVVINSDYIPEGMEWTEDGHILSHKGAEHQGGISISEVLMDKKDLNEALLDTNVVESEAHTFGVYEGVYLKYDSLGKNTFNQRIYLACPEFYRVLTIYIGDDVTKEEAYRFAEGLAITETDTMIRTKGLYTWSDIVHPEIYQGDAPVTQGSLTIHPIGEMFALGEVSVQGKDGSVAYTDGVTVCVDDVQIADDLALLADADIPAEWKDAVGEDGKLVQNHLSYIKSGDGVDRLDTVVDEQDVDQKLVYTTVTYTNTTQEELHHMLYIGSLMTMKQEDDSTYNVYLAEETPGDGYDYFIGDSVARTAEMGYGSVMEFYGDGGNYIPSIQPGESVQVRMAWIVNATDLENLYLNLNSTGNAYTFDEEILQHGLVYVGR